MPLVVPLETRYAALRPIAYAYKDGGIFADTNLGSLKEWANVKSEVEEIESKHNPRSKLELSFDLAKKLKTDYVMTDFYVDRNVANFLGAKVVWSNKSYTLMSINSKVNH